MADEVKKDPLLELLEAINSSNTGLAREMLIKNPELVLLKNSQNQNALRSIIATKNYELFEHVWQDERMHKAILDLANNDNISFIVVALTEVRGWNFFEYVLQKLNPKERSSLFYDKQNTFNLCALEFLVATRPYYKKTLVENNIFSQEQIDKIAKIANARTFLKFAYSPLGFFQGTDLVCRLQRFLVRDVAEASDLKFLEALKIISDETTILPIGGFTPVTPHSRQSRYSR